MDKKTSAGSAKSPDEMGDFQIVAKNSGLTITSAQMRLIEKLTKEEQELFWAGLDALTEYKLWREDAHVFALVWEVLADNARRLKEKKKQQ